MFEQLVMPVSGKMGSGKDTVAPAVMTQLGRPEAVRVSFASALKQETDTIFARFAAGAPIEEVAAEAGVAADHVDGLHRIWLGIPSGMGAYDRHVNVRAALQYWGTDVWRAIEEDHWVDLTMPEVFHWTAMGAPVYLTDARYPNEIEKLQTAGAVAVRLETPDHIRLARLYERDGHLPDPAAAEHSSETALDGWERFDVTHFNSGTLDGTSTEVAWQVAEVWAQR